jgi:hypothetical protein
MQCICIQNSLGKLHGVSQMAAVVTGLIYVFWQQSPTDVFKRIFFLNNV